jgi:hypothetical protein
MLSKISWTQSIICFPSYIESKKEGGAKPAALEGDLLSNRKGTSGRGRRRRVWIIGGNKYNQV